MYILGFIFYYIQDRLFNIVLIELIIILVYSICVSFQIIINPCLSCRCEYYYFMFLLMNQNNFNTLYSITNHYGCVIYLINVNITTKFSY